MNPGHRKHSDIKCSWIETLQQRKKKRKNEWKLVKTDRRRNVNTCRKCCSWFRGSIKVLIYLHNYYSVIRNGERERSISIHPVFVFLCFQWNWQWTRNHKGRYNLSNKLIRLHGWQLLTSGVTEILHNMQLSRIISTIFPTIFLHWICFIMIPNIVVCICITCQHRKTLKRVSLSKLKKVLHNLESFVHTKIIFQKLLKSFSTIFKINFRWKN